MIPAYLMLAAGVGLIMLEFMLGSFFVLFFGLGFLAVGVLGFFVDIAWEYQILLIATTSLVLLFALREPLKAKFNRHEGEVKDDFLTRAARARSERAWFILKVLCGATTEIWPRARKCACSALKAIKSFYSGINLAFRWLFDALFAFLFGSNLNKKG